MLFRTHKPAAPLSQFVEMFWFYSGNDVPHRRERVLPDEINAARTIDSSRFPTEVNFFQYSVSPSL
jgi:hypothetical protein